MSTVHYRFTSVLDYSNITFNDIYIKVSELKKEIMKKEKLKTQISDLVILNAQTKEEYIDDETFIPKNSSVLVHRVPVHNKSIVISDKARPSLQSSPTLCSQDKGFNASQTIRRCTGIPHSFLLEVDDLNFKGAMLTNKGTFAVPIINAKAYAVKKKERPPFLPEEKYTTTSFEESILVPEYVLCHICKEFLNDAAIIPCCGYSFCDECIRTNLLKSEEHVCPNCNESGVSPDTLCPNKALRLLVENFRKENKPSWQKDTDLLTDEASSSPSTGNSSEQGNATYNVSPPHDQQHSCQPLGHPITDKKYAVKRKKDKMLSYSYQICHAKRQRNS